MTVTIRTLDELLQPPVTAESNLNTQEYYVNMGPQHPISHGSLRFVARLDGETVKQIIPAPGYVHRGLEKMCEHLSYRQTIHLTDRMDYFSALMGNWAVSKTVEKAGNIEVSERAQYIRTIMAELQRVQSHALWWAVLGMDLGAFTPFLYGFREREIISEIFEETIGARLTMNYIQPGGVMYDILPDFAAKVKKVVAYLKPVVEEYDTLLSGNVILQERLRNVGAFPAEKPWRWVAPGRFCGPVAFRLTCARLTLMACMRRLNSMSSLAPRAIHGIGIMCASKRCVNR